MVSVLQLQRRSNGMRTKKWEVLAILVLGGLLGFGVATYRSHFTGQAVAGEPAGKSAKAGDPKPSSAFSPPGTFEGGTVVPAPTAPPFKGKIGRTLSASTP